MHPLIKENWQNKMLININIQLQREKNQHNAIETINEVSRTLRTSCYQVKGEVFISGYSGVQCHAMGLQTL